jgi:hypothetical protein
MCDALVELSQFPESQTFHVGVVMAGMRMLDAMRKPYPQTLDEEKRALESLRQENSTRSLDRCSKLPDDLPDRFKDHLWALWFRTKTELIYLATFCLFH